MMEEAEDHHRIIVPELWRMIYKQLGTKTRLQCKLVTEDWYYMLCDDVAFKDDRNVEINYRYLHESHPIVKVIAESETKFEKLSLTNIKIDPYANLSSFWTNLGYTVTHLSITTGFGFNESIIIDQLGLFENLKVLYVSSLKNYQEKLNGGYEPEWTLPSLETFKTGEKVESIYPSVLRKMLARMPNLKRFEAVWYYYFEDLACGEALMQVLMENVNKIKYIPFDRSFLPLLEAADLEAIEISICDYTEPEDLDRDLEAFESVLNRQINLKTYEFVTKDTLPTVRVDLITSLILYIWSENAAESLQDLVHFVKLKHFRLTVHKSGCFFGHNVLNLKLKEIELRLSPSPCMECFICLLKSLKQLQSFTFRGTYKENFLVVLKTFKNNFKKFYSDERTIGGSLTIEQSQQKASFSFKISQRWQALYVIEILPQLSRIRDLEIDGIEHAPEGFFEDLLPMLKEYVPNIEKVYFGDILITLLTLRLLREHLPPGIKEIQLRGTVSLHHGDPTDICQEFVNLFEHFKHLNLIHFDSLNKHKIFRYYVERFLVTSAIEIGPSMNMWSLIKAILY